MGVQQFQLRPARGFSLIELMVVIAIIGILISMLLPALGKAMSRAKGTKCLNNLKQMGVAFHTFAHDHNSRFPMQTPAREGGSLNFVNTPGAYHHVQVLSNELVLPALLICPLDKRSPAVNWARLRNANLSYFIGLEATPANPTSLLAGDRNITKVNPAGSSRQFVINQTASWTEEMHRNKGYVLFSDGSAHLFDDQKLRDALAGAARVGN